LRKTNATQHETAKKRLEQALAGAFAVQREIGHSATSTVYLARDLKHHRRVAIKVLHPELAATLVGERFHREIEIAASLSHPHIVPLYSSDEADGLLHYVMPYVEGESLEDRIDRDGTLPLGEALRIARKVAAALNYAHARGVVHRDIKPANIMLTAGEPLVSDFGIARAITAAGHERITETGVAVGSPVYMSPEQASGVWELDGRSDIYSLGCVLYEMLCGQPPLTGATLAATLRRKLEEEVIPLESRLKGIPPDLEAVLTSALAKNPEDRYASADAFAEALRHTSESTSAEDLGSVPAPKAGFWTELKRRKVYGTAILYGIAASGLVELAGNTLPYLGFPDQAITVVIVLAIAGLPVALALAWAFEVTREGVRRTGSIEVD
jgi:serine/threonine-protein kinase